MAKRNQSKRFLKEVRNLLQDFIRRDFINDKVLHQPKELKNVSIKLNVAALAMNTIFALFSYLTLAGNYMIVHGYTILGILLYLLYNAQRIVNTVYSQWDRNVIAEMEFFKDDALNMLGGKILSKVNGRIYQKENDGEFWKQAESEKITNCVANYLVSSWDIQNNYWYSIVQIIMTFIMLIATILTNTTIPQRLFIPLLLISSVASLLCSTYDRMQHREFKTEDRRLNNQKAVLKNDILRVDPIVAQDQKVRLTRYNYLSKTHYLKKKDLLSKDFVTDLITTAVHISASCILIIAYVTSVEKIELATMTGMTATLIVFNSAVRSFENILKVFADRAQSWDTLDKETSMMKDILKVYHLKQEEKPEPIDNLKIQPFENSYQEKSENDKAFRLILDEELSFLKGDCIALTGPSGSGKSTFMKVVTGQIKFHHEIPQKIFPLNYAFYDESKNFGSDSLWIELFGLDFQTKTEPSDEELAKMEYILKEMMLYKEISEQCKDFWTWFKENTANSLSKGQKQRLIIAKILFWLDNNIDVVALDECTSGLDAETDDEDNDADALKILRFIIDFCNHDKKRIIFLATHQKIDSLCNHRLHFRRKFGKTVIQKIY